MSTSARRNKRINRPNTGWLAAATGVVLSTVLFGCGESESGNSSAGGPEVAPLVTTVDFAADEVPQGPGFWESLDESAKVELANDYQEVRGSIGGSGPAGSFRKERVPSVRLVRLVDAYYEAGRGGDLIEAFRVADERIIISIVAPPVIPADEVVRE